MKLKRGSIFGYEKDIQLTHVAHSSELILFKIKSKELILHFDNSGYEIKSYLQQQTTMRNEWLKGQLKLSQFIDTNRLSSAVGNCGQGRNITCDNVYEVPYLALM